MNLEDLMSKTNAAGDPKKRYKDYVIETAEAGGTPLSFEEWFKLQQKTG